MVRFRVPHLKVVWLFSLTAVLIPLFAVLTATSMVFAAETVTAPGDLDTSFGNNGYVQIGVPVGYDSIHINAAVLDVQGRILVGGYVMYSYADPYGEYLELVQNVILQRYNPDGTLDTTFGNSGTAILDLNMSQANTLTIDSDGRIVFGGVYSSPPATRFSESIINGSSGYFLIGRFTADGILDTTFRGGFGYKFFGINPTLTGITHAIDVNDSGKITIAGSKDGMLALGQVNEDGSVNTDFGDGGAVLESSLASSDATVLTHTADGKLLAAGSMMTDGRRRSILVRYNADGTRDTSFATEGIHSGSFYGTAAALMLLPDDKILVASEIDDDDPADLSTRTGLAQFNSDGTLDTAFGENGLAPIYTSYQIGISSIQAAANDRLLIAGQSNGRGMLLRLSSGGGTDGDFGYHGLILSANPDVTVFQQVLMMPSGKLIAIGEHTLAQYFSEGTSGGEFIVNGSFEAMGTKPKEAGGWREKGTATKKMRRTCDGLDQRRGWIWNCAYLFQPGGVNTLLQTVDSTLTQPEGTLRFSAWISSTGVNKVAIKAKIRMADDTVTTLKLPVPDATDPRFIYLQTTMELTGLPSATVEKVLIKTRDTPSKLVIDLISLKYFPADEGRGQIQNPLALPAASADNQSAVLTSR